VGLATGAPSLPCPPPLSGVALAPPVPPPSRPAPAPQCGLAAANDELFLTANRTYYGLGTTTTRPSGPMGWGNVTRNCWWLESGRSETNNPGLSVASALIACLAVHLRKGDNIGERTAYGATGTILGQTFLGKQ
jgi:hypothetical protein